MTIYELYDSAIKTLPVNERLRLAGLILDDAASDVSIDTKEGQAYLAKLIQESLDSGPATPWTVSDVEQIKQNVIARSARRLG
jgi:hypothetical protein